MKSPLQFVLLLALLNSFALGQDVPRKEIYFGFFAHGPVGADRFLATEITFANPGSKAASVTVRPFAKGDIGVAPVEPTPIDVPANSFVTVDYRGQTLLYLGWTQINSTEPITAIEHVRLFFSKGFNMNRNAPTVTLASVGIAPSGPTDQFSVVVVDNDKWGTGISIAPRSFARIVNGTLTLLDTAGRSLAAIAVALGPTKPVINTASELFPELISIKEGTIVAQFDGDVIVSSLRFSKVSDIYTSNLVSSTKAVVF